MRQGILAVCVAVLLLPSWLAVRGDEEKVKLTDLPKAVADAVKKQFPKAKLVSASKELVEKKTVYEVTIKDGGRRVQVSLTPEGEVTEVEKEIAAEDLPKAVRTALDAKYPKAKITLAEEVRKGKELGYEVLLVTAEKKTFEIKFDPEGKVLNVEEKKEEKKKDNK